MSVFSYVGTQRKAPYYQSNGYEQPWSERDENDFDETLTASLRSFIEREARIRGNNDSVSGNIMAHCSPFDVGFLDGWPYSLWRNVYEHAYQAIKR